MSAIVDAHHHIWRQADLPWLVGPMQPRIFGPYEPIRRDYPIREYLDDIAGAGVAQSVYVQTNWAKPDFEREAEWVQRTHAETGWPHAIVAYADFSVERRAPPARPAGASCAGPGRAHATALARERDVPLRRARRSLRRSGDSAQYRPARGLWLVVRSAGVRAANGGRGAACAGLPARDVRASARRHAGGPSAEGRARWRDGHGEARGAAECRIEAVGPRHVHSSQRRGAHRRHRRRDGRGCSAPSAACSAPTSRSRSCGPIIDACRRVSERRANSRAAEQEAIFAGTARRVYRLKPT